MHINGEQPLLYKTNLFGVCIYPYMQHLVLFIEQRHVSPDELGFDLMLGQMRASGFDQNESFPPVGLNGLKGAYI